MHIVEKEETSHLFGLPLIKTKSKKKEIPVVEPNILSVQAGIYFSIERVNQIDKEKMNEFGSWVDFWTVVQLEVVRKEKKGKAMAALEHKLLRWANTDVIMMLSNDETSKLEMKESSMRYVIQQKIERFAAHAPTAKDDATVITQLEMDALSLSMMAKMNKQQYEIHANEK